MKSLFCDRATLEKPSQEKKPLSLNVLTFTFSTIVNFYRKLTNSG